MDGTIIRGWEHRRILVMGRLLALSNQELLPSLHFFDCFFLCFSFRSRRWWLLVSELSGLEFLVLGARHMTDAFLLSGWGLLRYLRISVHRWLFHSDPKVCCMLDYPRFAGLCLSSSLRFISTILRLEETLNTINQFNITFYSHVVYRRELLVVHPRFCRTAADRCHDTCPYP